MRFTEYLRLALMSLAANKLRSALTLLGIIIGVASVISMISIGEGARMEVTGELKGMGSTMIFIQPNYFDQDVMMGKAPTISLSDVERIKAECPRLSYVGPQTTGRGTMEWGREDHKATIVATNDEYAWMQGLTMGAGRFFSDADVRGRRMVAVLGWDLADKLFGEREPLGQKIRINGEALIVVGVMKRVGGSAFSGGMDSQDAFAYIPSTVARRIIGTDDVQTVLATAANVDSVRAATEEIEAFLRRHYGEKHKFRVQSAESFLQSARAILGIFTAILGGIGSISLLVGGIGVMNIMLVTVTERTREIGIRKAVGAKNADILKQFITEAVILCLAGGSVGILLGAAGAAIISAASPIPATVSGTSVIIAFLSSSLIGLIFGVYPAYKAAGLDPIAALRYE